MSCSTRTLKTVSTFAAFCFSEFVDWLLNKAFLNHNRTLLAAAFLVARHCCAEECVPWFSAYVFWFGKTFGPESFWASQQAFELLIKFLTDIVPYEPPACLRAHINKVRWHVTGFLVVEVNANSYQWT
jgi:hypothetical protein